MTLIDFLLPSPQLRDVLRWTYDYCNMFYPYRNMALNKAKYGGGSLVPSSTLRPPAAGGSLVPSSTLRHPCSGGPPMALHPQAGREPSATPSGGPLRAPSEERHPSCGVAAAGPPGGPLRAPLTMLEPERSHGGAAAGFDDGPLAAAGGGSALVRNGPAVGAEGGLGRQLMVYPDPSVR